MKKLYCKNKECAFHNKRTDEFHESKCSKFTIEEMKNFYIHSKSLGCSVFTPSFKVCTCINPKNTDVKETTFPCPEHGFTYY